MDFHIDPPVKYFDTFKREESTVLDSSRIMEYKRCPRAYFFRYVLNLTNEGNICWFTWGTAYHKFREVLEIEYKKHNATNPNKKECCAASLLPSMAAAQDSWVKKIAEDGAIVYPAKKYSFMTLERLLKACMFSFLHWEREKLNGNIEVIEVEQPFTVQLPNEQWIGGRFDQIIRMTGSLYDRDFKTSATLPGWYGSSLVPNHQFILYTWALKKLSPAARVGGALIELFYNDAEPVKKEAKNNTQLQAFPVSFNSEQYRKWEEDVCHVTDKMKESREKDIYPMYENSCKYCQFKEVCKASSEVSMTSMLKLKYKHKIWDHNSSD